MASIIVQLEVPSSLFLERCSKKKPGYKKWIGIAISFVGVTTMSQQDELSGSVISIALVLGGCCVGSRSGYDQKTQRCFWYTSYSRIAVFAAPQLF